VGTGVGSIGVEVELVGSSVVASVGTSVGLEVGATVACAAEATKYNCGGQQARPQAQRRGKGEAKRERQQRIGRHRQALYSAAKGGDLEAVQHVLQEAARQLAEEPGVSLEEEALRRSLKAEIINARFDDKYTALMTSAEAGHSEVVRLLLAEGADATAKNLYGQSAVHLATLHGRTSAVAALVERTEMRQAVMSSEHQGATALEWAVKLGHTDIVRILTPDSSAPVLDEQTEETPEKPQLSRAGSSPLEEGHMVLSRYRIQGEPLGEGGWCVVYLAVDTRSEKRVAVKTFRNQSIRDVGEDAIASRFAKEVSAFQALGLAPDNSHSGKKAWYRDPRQLFVNLLDFSRGPDGAPARADDGRFYTILELADGGSLESWLPKRSENAEEALSQVLDVGRALASALSWMVQHQLVHCDLKPANVMRFGGRWKLIDIEGVVSLAPLPTTVKPDAFTPLYACPELGRVWLDSAASSGGSGKGACCAPTAKMDVWSAGVVLLDVLARQCAFEDTFTGFQSAAFMELDGTEPDDFPMGLKEWYEWLVDPTPVLPSEHASPSTLAEALERTELQALLRGLLAKDPAQRFTTEQFRAHPALALEEAEPEDADERPVKCRCLAFRRTTPANKTTS